MFKLEIKGKVIDHIHIADTFWGKLAGYMFRRKPHHEAIMLKPCNSIHTFFMRFPIDVLFVDDQWKVIKEIHNLKPGKVVLPVKGATAVIEMKSSVKTS